MQRKKAKKLYLLINIPIMLLVVILLLTPYLITDNRTLIYYIGIVCRVTLGLWCVFNGIWNSCTDYYSIKKIINGRKINLLKNGCGGYFL